MCDLDNERRSETRSLLNVPPCVANHPRPPHPIVRGMVDVTMDPDVRAQVQDETGQVRSIAPPKVRVGPG